MSPSLSDPDSPHEQEPGGSSPQGFPVAPGHLSFFETIYAVLAALLGVRSREGFRRDLTYGNPASFVLVGILLVAVGCGALWVFVRLLTSYLLHQEGL